MRSIETSKEKDSDELLAVLAGFDPNTQLVLTWLCRGLLSVSPTMYLKASLAERGSCI